MATQGSAPAIGKSFAILDVAGASYWEYRDVERYLRNEVGGDYLATKTGLRGCQLYLAAYSTFSPEPVSKLMVGVVVVTLIAVDVAMDQIYETVYRRRQFAAQKLLALIDRSERYHAARAKVNQALNADSGLE